MIVGLHYCVWFTWLIHASKHAINELHHWSSIDDVNFGSNLQNYRKWGLCGARQSKSQYLIRGTRPLLSWSVHSNSQHGQQTCNQSSLTQVQGQGENRMKLTEKWQRHYGEQLHTAIIKPALNLTGWKSPWEHSGVPVRTSTDRFN